MSQSECQIIHFIFCDESIRLQIIILGLAIEEYDRSLLARKQ